MSDVSVNKTGLSIARQTGYGVLGGSPTWRRQQPNGYPKFGASLKTVQRKPISTSRQLGPGVPVSLDAATEYDCDTTMQVLVDRMEELLFAQAANWDMVFEGVAATGTGYTIPAATANQAGKIQWVSTGPKSLFYARGYANAANNGLRVLSADTAAAGTALTFGSGTVETPPSNALVELAGIRAATGDLAIVVTGTTFSMTRGNNGVAGGDRIDFTTIGIKPGQFIHIGGLTGAQQFSAGKGYARVLIVAAGTITGDKVTGTLATDPGTGDTVDLLFSRFVRNLPVDHNSDDDRYLQQFVQSEFIDADLGGAGVDYYEYALDQLLGQVTLNLPLEDKSTMNLQYVGSDVEVPTTSRKTNAATPIMPQMVEAFSTAVNVGSLRSSLVATAANMAFTNVTLTIKNNLKAQKIIGSLAARSIGVGLFSVEIGATMLFSDPAMIAAIRNNTTLTFDELIKNADGACFLDVPSFKPGDSKRDFPEDLNVTLDIPGTAYEDPTLHTSLSASFFPVVP